MDEDFDFIQDIQAEPNDELRRLIYADWLEDRGDIRGAFLRLEAQLARMSVKDEGFADAKDRLEELRTQICPEWVAELDRTPIENCPSLLSFFRCPKRWEYLELTNDCEVRQCEACGHPVFYCDSIEKARFLARRGYSVAVNSHVVRAEDDLRRQLPLFKGIDADDF